MSTTRRTILAAAGGFAAASILDGVKAAPELARASKGGVLFLCSDGLRRHEFAARNHQVETSRHLKHIVRVLTHDDFGATGALLDGFRGSRMVALLDDADGLVIDSLMTRRGARDRTSRRIAGGALLLTATL